MAEIFNFLQRWFRLQTISAIVQRQVLDWEISKPVAMECASSVIFVPKRDTVLYSFVNNIKLNAVKIVGLYALVWIHEFIECSSAALHSSSVNVKRRWVQGQLKILDDRSYLQCCTMDIANQYTSCLVERYPEHVSLYYKHRISFVKQWSVLVCPTYVIIVYQIVYDVWNIHDSFSAFPNEAMSYNLNKCTVSTKDFQYVLQIAF